MGAVPDDPTCSICRKLYTYPPKTEIKTMADIKISGCAPRGKIFSVDGRKLIPLHYVCADFVGGYVRSFDGSPYPPAPVIEHHLNYLWENRPDNTKPYWVFRPFIRFEDLPNGNF